MLRDDGVSYGDFLEQLTYLIFIKMADEYSKPPFSRSLGVPAEHSWGRLAPMAGEIIDNLEAAMESFREIVEELR